MAAPHVPVHTGLGKRAVQYVLEGLAALPGAPAVDPADLWVYGVLERIAAHRPVKRSGSRGRFSPGGAEMRRSIPLVPLVALLIAALVPLTACTPFQDPNLQHTGRRALDAGSYPSPTGCRSWQMGMVIDNRK